MTFKQPKDHVIITESDISNDLTGDIIAKKTISTDSTVNIAGESNISMRAGNSITFSPGFSVHAGSELSARIERIFDCIEGGEPPRILIQSMLEEEEEKEGIDKTLKNGNDKIFDFIYKIFPNPSHEWVTFQYFLSTETQLHIDLVNFLGQRVKHILPNQNQQAGSYELQIPVSDLADGTYFLTILSANQRNVEKIVICK